MHALVGQPFSERQMVQSLDSSSSNLAARGLACDCFGVPQERRTSCCLALPASRAKRPDLAIYSQEEQIAKGAEPTWNNPDIITTDFPYERLNDETQVTVRNLSPDIWAVGAQVQLSISPFGIGFERRPVASQTISLGPSASATLSFPLSRADVAGDPHDPNRINNSGSQVLAASRTSVSGRRLTLDIPVHNLAAVARRITLRVLAGDLIAAVEPASRSFAPRETGNVRLRTEIPASIVGTPDHRTRRHVTVIAALDDGALVGGVTQLVVIDV
jgi:hypothetical protein